MSSTRSGGYCETVYPPAQSKKSSIESRRSAGVHSVFQFLEQPGPIEIALVLFSVAFIPLLGGLLCAPSSSTIEGTILKGRLAVCSTS
jgi:hypothetical protein